MVDDKNEWMASPDLSPAAFSCKRFGEGWQIADAEVIEKYFFNKTNTTRLLELGTGISQDEVFWSGSVSQAEQDLATVYSFSSQSGRVVYPPREKKSSKHPVLCIQK